MPQRLAHFKVDACAVVVTVAATLLFASASAEALAACDGAPPSITDLQLERYYSDAQGSVVDPEKQARNEDASAPLTDFLAHVTKDADAALRSDLEETRTSRAACAVAWLMAWAEGGALLGNVADKQASHRRSWDMTGAALAYVKVRPYAGPADRKVIEAWLKKLALASLSLFDDPGVKRNNHWYWLGLGVGAVGFVADDASLWDRARAIMHDAADNIDPEGMLPLELERGKRALHYHAFAVTPLVVLAELASAKGEDWYGFDAGALHRLVEVTARGLESPAAFENKTDRRQEWPVKAGGGWLVLYENRFPHRLDTPLTLARPGHRWIGGDARQLLTALRLRSAVPAQLRPVPNATR